ncbi:hypothetical protein B0H17DRAFT_1131915 [Mycena rosella]|uniref:Uncharacterized protein n=1 Tax=Mycena rosella TaxID=1033263 RepID=A0AAD7DM71_MYCRO|nr:hypothetical protein B0H17DRAFT_1131915 [Mycena rosella]
MNLVINNIWAMARVRITFIQDQIKSGSSLGEENGYEKSAISSRWVELPSDLASFGFNLRHIRLSTQGASTIVAQDKITVDRGKDPSKCMKAHLVDRDFLLSSESFWRKGAAEAILGKSTLFNNLFIEFSLRIASSWTKVGPQFSTPFEDKECYKFTENLFRQGLASKDGKGIDIF